MTENDIRLGSASDQKQKAIRLFTRLSWARSLLLPALFLPLVGAASANPSPRPTLEASADTEAHCRMYFHDACSEAMGKWLPTFGFASTWWAEATRIDRRDGFVYENERPQSPHFLGYQGPDDGTFVVYGDAGPPKAHVVYDTGRRIAFYEQGCCSWHDVVAAAGVSPPPKSVVARDLGNLHTVRGIRLGQSPAQVIKVYGPASLIRLQAHRDIAALHYTTWPPEAEIEAAKRVPTPCGQFQNFFFRRDRLVLIQFGNGC